MRRNFEVVAWMLRQHLNFVADFTFHPNTPDAQFNKRLASLVGAWSKRRHCDPARRHPLRRLMRISEACRVIDGDLLWVKLRRGQVQLIRGDRIQNPFGVNNSDEWKHGVRLDRNNAAVEYAVHKRTIWGQMVFERNVPWRNVLHHAYWDDCDQVRGISPLAQALNSFRDVYENIGYALARAKLSQLIGLAITRKPPDLDTPGGWAGLPAHDDRREAADAGGDEEGDEDEDDDERYDRIDYGTAPFQVELDPGDDIKFLESQMPSATFQQFNLDVLLMGLKALDMPFSFYREDFTNFFGSRGAINAYRRSCRPKQEDNAELLDELIAWKIVGWIASGALELPAGWTIADVDWAWVPRGIEWWDKAKEIAGDILAIQNGLDTPQRICLDHGSGTFEQNVKDIAAAAKLAQAELSPYGMKIGFASPVAGTPATPAPTDPSADDKEVTDGEDDEQQDEGTKGSRFCAPLRDRGLPVRRSGGRQRSPSNQRTRAIV